jgi:Spy/CpxP family protein refolding chaperone
MGPPPFQERGDIPGFLKRKLDLTPAQEDSVRAIFARHRPEMEAMWRVVRSRFDSIRTAVDSEIGKQLTATQRARFEELRRRFEGHRWRRPPPDHP